MAKTRKVGFYTQTETKCKKCGKTSWTGYAESREQSLCDACLLKGRIKKDAKNTVEQTRDLFNKHNKKGELSGHGLMATDWM